MNRSAGTISDFRPPLADLPDLAAEPPAGWEARVRSTIDAFRRGEIVVVTDDGDREDEGDLFVAAPLCTPAQMAFIIRHTSGIVCAPLCVADARRLRLEPMVATNDAPLGTAFTVSVDLRQNLRTGISAEERCATVRALADASVDADAFVRPGHVFPLIARDGGVLVRSGHTEACIDLCRLAGLPPVGVLSELVNDDGTIKRGRQVVAFAKAHGLQILAINDIILYRQARERLVERVEAFTLSTAIGPLRAFAYTTPFDRVQHLAVVHGEIGDGVGVLTRLHRSDIAGDVFGGGAMIEEALQHIARAGRGVLVYLRDGTHGVPLTPLATATAPSPDELRGRIWRDVGIGAQILQDQGISSIRLLTADRVTYAGLDGFGIAIDQILPIGPRASGRVSAARPSETATLAEPAHR